MLTVRLYLSTEEQHLLPVLPGFLLRCVWLNSFRRSISMCFSNVMALCFLGCLGDTQFSFRLRQSVGRRAMRRQEEVYNRDAPVTLQVSPCFLFSGLWSGAPSSGTLLISHDLCLQSEASHFFGYVYFRQVKDVSVKRGYFQKVGVLGSTCTHLGVYPMMSCDHVVTLSSSLWC